MSSKLSWFKLMWLNSEERAALKKGMEKEVESTTTTTFREPEFDGYYKKILMSHGIITVILNDGTPLSRQGGKELLDQVREASSERAIVDLMTDIPYVTDNKAEEVIQKKDLDIFVGNDQFEVKGEEVFLKGVHLALPTVVTSTFIEILEKQKYFDIKDLDNEFQALKMFWLKLALNPLKQSREDLLLFVKENDVRITGNGNLVLYRRIVSVTKSNKKLTEFISQQYYKVKKNHKSPKNYNVFEVSNDSEKFEYILGNSIADEKVQSWNSQKDLGTLHDLYLNLPDMDDNRYTSWHKSAKTGKTDIRIGAIYNIPDTDINLNNGLCAAGGLHAAAVNYNYSGFGDTPVVVLVNPSKAITVPRGETSKLRTTEMFIVAINDQPIGVHFDTDSLFSFDEEYHDLSIQELELALENKSFDTLSVQDNLPEINIQDIRNIKEMLRKRVQTIV